jgi:hypothetical protein
MFYYKYYVTSPEKKRILVFEWVTGFNPDKKWFIKIYPKRYPKDFVAIRPIMDFPIDIFWGDTIKVRGGILVKADTANRVINWKADYTKKEAKEVMADTVKWKHYLQNKIQEGAYE